jgi:pimeloyl-ACP methyl ester carboxylesterase
MSLTRPVLSVFRFRDIVANMWSKDGLQVDRDYRFMIFCYGLPSHPYQHSPAKVERLIEEGFVLLYPNYVGTWASYGTMSWEKCVDTALRSVDFLKRGKGEELRGNSVVSWKVKDITLVGGSFGGSVALVAGAKSEDVKFIVSVAAPTNWRDHSRIPEETGEPIDELFHSIQRGWENLWRIPSKKEWRRLATGNVDLNPVDYVEKLRDKNVLLIHGELDNIVSLKRSVGLHERIKNGKGKHELLVLEGEGHRGNDVVGREDVVRRVLNFVL